MKLKPAHMILLAIHVPLALLLTGYVIALNTPVKIVPPPRPLVPKVNGFPILKEAASEIVRGSDISSATLEKPRPGRIYSLGQKRELVLVNQLAVRKAKSALRLSCYQGNPYRSLNAPYVSDQPFRYLTRAIVLAGDVAWEDGRQSEAVDYYLDAVTFGRQLPNQTGLDGQTLGLTCEYMGRRPLWRRLETIDTGTAERCLTRLIALESERVPLAVSLAEEKYTALSRAMEKMEYSERAAIFICGISNEGDTESLAASYNAAFARYCAVTPRMYVAHTLTRHMDRLIAQANQPFIESNTEIDSPRDWCTQRVSPETTQHRFRYTVSRTGDVLLRVALALRVYKGRTGRSPAHLSELVAAKLLPYIPDDPFARPGTPLRYEQKNGKATLYSIGPDGVNNDGKGIGYTPTFDVKRKDRNVKNSSTGDMVAGWHPY